MAKRVLYMVAVCLAMLYFIFLVPRMDTSSTIGVAAVIIAIAFITYHSAFPPKCSKCGSKKTRVKSVRECQDCGHSESTMP